MALRIVGGKFKNRKIEAPKNDVTRPTQEALRETVFNICQQEIEDATILDLFAGSGAIGLEAISRGALHATFVEKNRKAFDCIQKNIESLKVLKQTTLYRMDALDALKQIKQPFDIIYIDPPYGEDLFPIVTAILDHSLLKKGSLLFLEERFLPKKQENAPQFSSLSYLKSRKVGDALLHSYRAT